METDHPAVGQENPCQSCGACCAYSSNWPRFSTEDDETLALIPEQFVNTKLSGMRCEGERCSALSGEIGIKTACMVYAARPEVCRTCMPGDPECTMARRRFGMPALMSRHETERHLFQDGAPAPDPRNDRKTKR